MELKTNVLERLKYGDEKINIHKITTETELVDKSANLIGACRKGKISIEDFKERMAGLRNDLYLCDYTSSN